MVYDISTYHYLYGANPRRNVNDTSYTFDLNTPFKKANKIITISDKYSSANDGIDTFSNIEKLTFSDHNALFTSKEIKLIYSLGFQSEKVYSGKSDIKATLDQVTGLNTDSGKMFRLYDTSFKRLPDPNGLSYWIGSYSSGKDDKRAVASSFLASAEFKECYGEDVSNQSYVKTLYINILGRDADVGG